MESTFGAADYQGRLYSKGAYMATNTPQEAFRDFQNSQKPLTGLAGFAAGPFGPPASMALSGLLSGLGSIFGGDSGRKRRLREAESIFKQLSNSEIDEGALSKGSALFERSQLPTLERLYSQSASRVGLDSGIGQGVALGGFQDILASFNSQQLRDEQGRVHQRRLTGAQGLLSLADI